MAKKKKDPRGRKPVAAEDKRQAVRVWTTGREIDARGGVQVVQVALQEAFRALPYEPREETK